MVGREGGEKEGGVKKERPFRDCLWVRWGVGCGCGEVGEDL